MKLISFIFIIIIIIVFYVLLHELAVGRLRLRLSISPGLTHHRGTVPAAYNLLRWSLPSSSWVAPGGACLLLPMNSKSSSPSLHHPFSSHVPASEVCSSSSSY